MDCAGAIRRQLGPGYLESVYKNAMLVELCKNRLSYEAEKSINVYYDGHLVGEYKADIVVENQLILELKAVNSLHVAHELQLVNYLTATGMGCLSILVQKNCNLNVNSVFVVSASNDKVC